MGISGTDGVDLSSGGSGYGLSVFSVKIVAAVFSKGDDNRALGTLEEKNGRFFQIRHLTVFERFFFIQMKDGVKREEAFHPFRFDSA